MAEVVSADGTRIAVDERGPVEGPVVVLVHGLGLSTRSWDAVSAELARTCRVVVYDLRGHGRSAPAVSGDYGLPAHAADLSAVLSRVPRSARPVLVGHSLGGGIILAHARAFPGDRVGGAVLVGSGGSAETLPGLPGRRLPPRLRRSVRLGWLRILYGVARSGKRLRPARTVTNGLARLTVFTTDAPTPAVDDARSDFLATDPAVLARTVFGVVSDENLERAPDLTAPVLLLRGDRDKQVRQGTVERLAHLLPSCELVTLSGAGHMLPFTDPGAVADQVARFAREVGASEGGGSADDAQEG